MNKNFLRTFAALFLAMKPTTSEGLSDLIIYAWDNPEYKGYRAYPKYLKIKGEVIESEYWPVSSTSYPQKWWFTAKKVNQIPRHPAALKTYSYDPFELHWYVANIGGPNVFLKIDTFYLPEETWQECQPSLKVDKYANIVERWMH